MTSNKKITNNNVKKVPKKEKIASSNKTVKKNTKVKSGSQKTNVTANKVKSKKSVELEEKKVIQKENKPERNTKPSKNKEVEKKKTSKLQIMILLVLIIVFILVYKYCFGCGLKLPIKSEYESNNQLSTNIATVKLKEGTLTKTSAILLVTNNSEYDITYGSRTLEHSMFDEWYMILPKRNIPSIDRAVNIDPGETKEIYLDWENEYGKLSLGSYRIVIDIHLSDEHSIVRYDGDQLRKFFISYEFKI